MSVYHVIYENRTASGMLRLSTRCTHCCVEIQSSTSDMCLSVCLSVCLCVWQFGEMLYLVAQNLGLWHVTQRHDRDNYVTIVKSNLLPAYRSDLSKLDPRARLLSTFQQPYDYASIMHFPPKVCTLVSDYITVTTGITTNTYSNRPGGVES